VSVQKFESKEYAARCALIELVLPEGHSLPGPTAWAIRQAIKALELTSRGHGRALQRAAQRARAAEPANDLAAARARRQLAFPVRGFGPKLGGIDAADVAAAWQAIEEREAELYPETAQVRRATR
jgi:hypothetical protein